MAFKLCDSNNHVIGNMTDVVTASDGEMWITLETGHKFRFRSNNIRWDNACNAYIKKDSGYHQDALDNARYSIQARALRIAINSVYGLPSASFDNPFRNPKKDSGYHQDALDNARYIAQARAMYSAVYQKEVRAAMNAATIKNAIFAPPATIVYWSDGSKTVVKCSERDIFDPEKGLAMAIAKRCGGNKGSYYKEIRNWVEKSGKKYPGKAAPQKETAHKSDADRNRLKKYISEANKDWDEFLKASVKDDRTILLLKMTALTADLKNLETEINK